MPGDIVINIAANVARVQRGLIALQRQVRDTMSTITGIIQTASATSISALVQMGDAVARRFREVELILSRQGMRGAEAVRHQVYAVAEATRHSVDEVAAAAQTLLRGGLDPTAVVDSLEVVGRAAEAMQVTPAEAARSLMGLAQTLRVLRGTAGDARVLEALADILATISLRTPVQPIELLNAVTGTLAVRAEVAGQSLGEMLAWMTALTQRGLSASQAAAAIIQALTGLQLAVSSHRETWQQLGVAVYDASGQMRPLGDIIADLNARLGQLTQQERDAELTALGFTYRHRNAIETLRQAAEAAQQARDDLGRTAGTMRVLADAVSSPWLRATSTVQAAMVRMGEALRTRFAEVMGAVGIVLRSVASVVEAIPPQVIRVGVALMAAAGAARFVAGVWAALTRIGQALTKITRGLASAQAVLTTIMGGWVGVAKAAAAVAVGISVYYLLERAISEDTAAIEQNMAAATSAADAHSLLATRLSDVARYADEATSSIESLEQTLRESVSAVPTAERLQRALERMARGDTTAELLELRRQLEAAASWRGGASPVAGIRVMPEDADVLLRRVREELDEITGGAERRLAQVTQEVELLRRGVSERELELELLRKRRRELGLETDVVDQLIARERERAALIDRQRELEDLVRRVREASVDETQRQLAELADLMGLVQRGVISRAEAIRYLQARREELAGRVAALPSLLLAGQRETASLLLRWMTGRTRADTAAERTAVNTGLLVRQMDRLIAHLGSAW